MTSGTGRNRRSGLGLLQAVALALVVLSLLALYSVSLPKCRAPCSTTESRAVVEIAALDLALAAYVSDERTLPTGEVGADPERNEFPILFEALFGEKKPRGKGGRNAPYAEFKEDRVAVEDPATRSYRRATSAEIRDPGVRKHLVDPWGNPYIYRAGKTRGDAKIYSLGPNEEDDTMNLVANGDDLGNW